MYQIRRIGNDKYDIVYKDFIISTVDKSGLIKGMIKLGTEENEIILGIADLEVGEEASYGINKRFIFSKKIIDK